MIRLFIFSLGNFYLAKYLKDREISYLFLGSLITALFYIFEPVIIFLIPLYVPIFYFSCNNHCSTKRLSQLFVFVFPTAATAFSLSYISWIYGRGFRFIYLKGGLFETAVEYSGVNLDFSLLTDFSVDILFYLIIYIFMLIWIIYKKGFFEPFIYIYLMPIFFYEVKYLLEIYNPGLFFFSIYVFFGLFYFWLFKTEMNKFTKLTFCILLLINFYYFIYKLYLSFLYLNI